MANRRDVVVVLGMHRAGTSLAASMLEAMGVRLGDDLIAAKEDNPSGFFEHAGFMTHIKAIEEIISRQPFRPEGMLDFPAGWTDHEDVRVHRDALKANLLAELDRTKNGMFGFKDPRTVRMLDLWKAIFEELKCRPRYVLALRSPAAVIASNIKRTQMSQHEAELLWMWHYVDAVRQTDMNFSAVINYERWFSEPHKQAAELVKALGLEEVFDTKAFDKVAGKHIQADLNHGEEEPLSVSSTVQNFYDALSNCLTSDDSRARCVSIAEEFLAYQDMFTPWAAAMDSNKVHLDYITDTNRTVGRQVSKINALNRTIEDLKSGAELTDYNLKLQTLLREQESHVRDLSLLDKKSKAERNELIHQRMQAENSLKRERDARLAEIQRLRHEIERMQRTLIWRVGRTLGLAPSSEAAHLSESWPKPQ